MKAVKGWRLGPGHKDNPIATDFSSESDTMLVTFGGLKGGVGRILPFEFFNLTGGIDVKRVFVRDLFQAWYHKGLPGVGDDIDGVVGYLRKLIGEQNPWKVVVVGNSAGGYAALLFGCLLGVQEVHSFSPQTFIDTGNRRKNKDDRWGGAQILNAHKSSRRKEWYFDLRQVFDWHVGRTTTGKYTTEYRIHYQKDSRLDRIHATRMKYPGISLHAYKEGGDDHHLVVHLKKSGKLKRILEEALE